MDSFRMLHPRVEWTRGWLDTLTYQNKRAPNQDLGGGYEFLHLDDTSSSDFGVESLTEQTCSGEEDLSSEQAISEISIQSFISTPCTHCSSCGWPFICERCGTAVDLCDSLHPVWYYEGNGNPSDDEIDRKQAINYELCGKRDDNSFSDLRSASKARKRRRREQEKYYSWRRVKPGWLGAQVNGICELAGNGCYCLGSALTRDNFTVTKKMMFEEAQGYPRPPTYHRSSRKDHLRAWHSRIERAKREGKHRRCHLFDSLNDHDDDDKHTDMIDSAGFHRGDDFMAFLNDHWDWKKQAEWCYICNCPWGLHNKPRHEFEVDEIDSFTFKTSKDGKSWTLSWVPERGPKPNRAPAVLPYTKQDWVMDPIVGLGLYTDHDA